MRRIRNPRYAPEFLERKLSPSGIPGNPPPAEVGAMAPAPPQMQAMAEPGDPPPVDPIPPPDPSGPAAGEPGDPPPVDPIPPPDPSGPAYFVYATA
jgi:hypothetical protein